MFILGYQLPEDTPESGSEAVGGTAPTPGS